MITTSKASFDHLMSFVYDTYADDIDVRFDYSGRGMFGKECVGFVVRSPANFLITLGAALRTVELDNDEMDDSSYGDVPNYNYINARMDNMAYDTIVYFPNWVVSK